MGHLSRSGWSRCCERCYRDQTALSIHWVSLTLNTCVIGVSALGGGALGSAISLGSVHMNGLSCSARYGCADIVLYNDGAASFCHVVGPPPPQVNVPDAEDEASLSRHGVTHIVSVHNNAKPLLPDMTYLCIAASDSERQNLSQHFRKSIQFIHECRLHGGGCLIHCLAGVSRSTTILVAYLMTVTAFGWEECLSAVRAARSYVGPNLGFQQQLQEYEMTLVKEYRMWLLQEYGRSPFKDQEKVLKLLSEQEQKEQLRQTQNRWINRPQTDYSLPYKAYGADRSRWSNV